MSRTFQDDDFLLWEVYPSGGAHGFSDRPNVIFNCLTGPNLRPRFARLGADSADAQKQLVEMSEDELRELFGSSKDIA